MPAGRPTKYKADFARVAKKMCQMGATDNDLAEAFGVTEKTINTWKRTQPEFLQSLKEKACADDLVEQALFKRAVGVKVKDDKVFNNNGKALIVPGEKEFPPDTAAAFIWLQNRRPDKWRKEQPIEGGATADDIANALAKLADKLPS